MIVIVIVIVMLVLVMPRRGNSGLRGEMRRWRVAVWLVSRAFSGRGR